LCAQFICFKMKKLSLIISVYNEEKNVKQLIEQINEALKDWEFIQLLWR